MVAKFGTFGNRPRIARALLECEEETPLPGSRFLCFSFLPPLNFRVNSFTWLCIFFSTGLLLVRGSRRSAYTLRGVWRSGWLPNFNISLLRPVITDLSDSFIFEVVGLTSTIFEPQGENFVEALQILLGPLFSSAAFLGQFELTVTEIGT